MRYAIAGILTIAVITVMIALRSPRVSPSPSPAVSPLPTETDATDAFERNTTGFPLRLPTGFSISIFAKNLGAPRVMIWDPAGRLA